jgi:hypothetical protein
MVIYDKIVEDKYEPQSTNVLWLKPVESGFCFYRYKDGKWDALKLMNDKGTPSTDDDIPWEGGGSSITPGVPIPHDTVNSESIVDGSVQMEDLDDDLRSKIQQLYNKDDESLHVNYDEIP